MEEDFYCDNELFSHLLGKCDFQCNSCKIHEDYLDDEDWLDDIFDEIRD